MARTLSAVANAVRGRLVGADVSFGPVSTDTREIGPGALFVALRGERFDGNDFVAAAHERGAAGALVSRLTTAVELPQIAVADTRQAFGSMARAWRENFSLPVIAVTGSSGKTTVKELIASILGTQARVCVTLGNLNNEIGVPITLMRLSAEHQVLVVELGANHAGEIAHLSGLVEPTVGVITNAGEAHLEGFGSLEGVAAAKGELLDHLPRAGTAVLNADDRFYGEWRARSRAASVLSFGLGAAADCTVLDEPRYSAAGSRFTMRLPGGETLQADLPLLGPHNITNALAAAAATQAAGAGVEDIREGLRQATPVAGRLRALAGKRGATIIDDSYNANPSSVRAALDHMKRLAGRRVLALGNMAELGNEAIALHRGIGEYATGKVEMLIGIGELAAHAARAFGGEQRLCADAKEAARVLAGQLSSDTTVLVKGSRVMRLEALVRALADDPQGGAAPC